MWSYFLLLQMSLAAALSTDWSPSRRRAGKQAVAAVHPRSDKSGDSRLCSPKRQQLDAAPDETELAKATAHRLEIVTIMTIISVMLHGCALTRAPCKEATM